MFVSVCVCQFREFFFSHFRNSLLLVVSSSTNAHLKELFSFPNLVHSRTCFSFTPFYQNNEDHLRRSLKLMKVEHSNHSWKLYIRSQCYKNAYNCSQRHYSLKYGFRIFKFLSFYFMSCKLKYFVLFIGMQINIIQILQKFNWNWYFIDSESRLTLSYYS